MSKRKIGNEPQTLLESAKSYFRLVFSGEWLRPNNSNLSLLTPQQRIEQREFTRTRIKFMIWGVL